MPETLPPTGTTALDAWLVQNADGWRPDVRLSASPTVRADRGHLELGLPLLRCLRDSELCVVLRDARAGSEPPPQPSRWRRRRAAPEPVADTTAERRQRYGALWEQVAARVAVVAEGWAVLQREWLAPAAAQGVWYDRPFTELRDFLDACARSGLVEDQARLPGRYLDLDPDLDPDLDLARAERDVARLLVPDELAQTPARSRADHPHDVVVAGWRARLERGLAVASEVSGRQVGAALGDLLPVALYADLALADGLEGTSITVHELLVAAVGLALLESGGLVLSWEWPTGTTMLDPRGGVHDLDALVEDRAAIAERVGALDRVLLP